MSTTKILDFDDFCKETIKDKLPEYVEQDVYMCELGMQLTEGMNCDGTFTYSRSEAKDYLREWWDDADEYWNYETFSFGEHFHNPFENPEAYLVCMVIEGVRSLLSQCHEVAENWNDQVELTQEMCDSIIEQLDELYVEW